MSNLTPADIDKEIDELVHLHESRKPDEWCCLREPSVRKAIKQLLRRVGTEVIGEPQPIFIPPPHHLEANNIRNGLRTEQHKKLNSLVGEE